MKINLSDWGRWPLTNFCVLSRGLTGRSVATVCSTIVPTAAASACAINTVTSRHRAKTTGPVFLYISLLWLLLCICAQIEVLEWKNTVRCVDYK